MMVVIVLGSLICVCVVLICNDGVISVSYGSVCCISCSYDGCCIGFVRGVMLIECWVYMVCWQEFCVFLICVLFVCAW